MSNNPPKVINVNNLGIYNDGSTISGGQVGIQYNDPTNQKNGEQFKILIDSYVEELYKAHPGVTREEILKILLQNLEAMPEKNPSYWMKWQNILSVVFAGGLEAVKVIAPIAGIPIEIGKKIYEVYHKHQKA
jgi:hypothetical protein